MARNKGILKLNGMVLLQWRLAHSKVKTETAFLPQGYRLASPLELRLVVPALKKKLEGIRKTKSTSWSVTVERSD